MFPNPQDVLPLPPRPDAEHYRKRAKELSKACKSGDATAVQQWAERWLEDLARLTGNSLSQRDRERRTQQVAEYARERMAAADCALSEAQLVLARSHGFTSWTRLLHHLEELAARESGTSSFERAADAVVSGDVATLSALLRSDPSLARARSAREHGATLLHYVSANGVENFRQKSPANIVDVARLLLDAGAEVDAECDVYGGGATALLLTVTSAHPRAMGVQNALADLLLDRGARMGNPVRDCLMNGCPEAAAHLVLRGAPVNSMEDAAGIGRLDLVQQRWEAGHTSEASLALRIACWYGRIAIVEYLLNQGVDVESRDPEVGNSALHIAAFNGCAEIASLLLRHGADVHAVDLLYGTPPITWALHAWLVENRPMQDAYRATVVALLGHGATVKHEWIDDDRLPQDSGLWKQLKAAEVTTI